MTRHAEGPQPGPTDFLAVGGEMGARIRAHDWGPSLGPPSAWPSPLRTALRILLTTNHPVFLFWGPEHLCFYNDAYSRSLGPEQHPALLGARGRDGWREIWSIIGPQVEQVMAGGGATWHENHLVPITRHGHLDEVYWTYSYSPVDDASAARGVGGVLVLCTETTEQVLAARRLAVAEARWRSLFDQAPGFTCVLRGPDHRFEYANERYYALVGRRDLLGKSVAEALPEVASQGFLDLLDRVYRTGEPYVAESSPVDLVPDGEAGADAGAGRRFYLDFIYQPVRDDAGQVTGIFVQGADVTRRALAEQSLAAAEQAARLERDTLTETLDALPVIVTRYDPALRDIWVNRRFTELLGWDDADVRSGRLVELCYPDAALRRDVQAFMERHDGTWQVVPTCTRDGRQLRVSWTNLLVANGLQVGVGLDLTERLDAAEQLAALNTRLQAADRRKDEFLATLSHELRNPLAPLLSAAALLKRPGLPPAAVPAAVAIIDRQVRQMALLLEDLMDVARIANGKIGLSVRDARLADLVTAAVETVESRFAQRSLQLTTDLHDGLPLLRVDPLRISQVLSNLLTNAAKYTPPGGRVRVSAAATDGELRIDVVDTGIGIAAEHLEDIFELFTQVDAARRLAPGGLGVGLSLSRALVQLHGGRLTAHSAGAGQGTTFTICLPLHAASPVADHPPGHTPGAGAGAGAGASGACRVLVADDNVDAATTLSMLLKLEGHEVATANGGRRALELALSMRPDVVVLDIGMPDLDGYAVARALRASGMTARLIAVTGWAQESDRAAAAAAGFDHHVTKPVDPDEIHRLIAASRPAAP